MNQTVIYKYADGNGNVYTLSSTTLTYDPVTREESSSGTYSGGEPKTISITKEQFDSLRSLLEDAIGNSAIHIKDRVKMSGAIIVVDGSETRRYIIQPGRPALTAIEALLKEVCSC